jgi:hypothetical protein
MEGNRMLRAPRFPALLLAGVLLPAAALAEDLSTFLQAVTKATRPKTAVRALGTVKTESPDGTVEDQIAVVYGPTGDLYLELHKDGTRALITGAGKDAFVVDGGKGGAAAFALDAPFGKTQFTREDLHPFDDAHYKAPRISDKGAFDLTATVEGKPSQYELIVITFDLAKKVPTKTLYYHEKANNLVKMRQDGDFVSVGDAWLPGSVSMQHFQLRAKTSLALEWEAAAAPEGIFTRDALGKPSPIKWP